MLLIDTSVWVEVLEDNSLDKRNKLNRIINQRKYYLPVFSKMLLLQRCRSEAEWAKTSFILGSLDYLKPQLENIWENSARLYFELQSQGTIVSSNLNCAIAWMALENNYFLYHCHDDFEAIAKHLKINQKNIKQQLAEYY